MGRTETGRRNFRPVRLPRRKNRGGDSDDGDPVCGMGGLSAVAEAGPLIAGGRIRGKGAHPDGVCTLRGRRFGGGIALSSLLGRNSLLFPAFRPGRMPRQGVRQSPSRALGRGHAGARIRYAPHLLPRRRKRPAFFPQSGIRGLRRTAFRRVLPRAADGTLFPKTALKKAKKQKSKKDLSAPLAGRSLSYPSAFRAAGGLIAV